MKTNSDFSDAKVGDLVTSLIQGHGVIIEISKDDDFYPIMVKFQNDYYGLEEDKDFFLFNADGRYLHGDFAPILFKGHIAIDSLSINYNTI